MENPATWNKAQKTIHTAILEHDKALATQMCGPSLVTRIYNKLYGAGLLKEETEPFSE